LAVILAPTDASLGQSVVSNPRVPARIRQALNIESGLNDGIAMPFLILALSLAVSTEQQLGSGTFLLLVARQILFGILAGLLIGFLGARYIQWGDKSGWMSRGAQKICWLALIIVALSNWYGKRIAELDKKGAADSEMKPVPEMPTRAESLPPVAVTSSSSGGL